MLGVMVVLLIMGGCVTNSAMMVGSVREILTGFREVQLSAPTLQVRYKTKAWYGPSRVLENSQDRWTNVSFGSLPWLALDRLQMVPPFHNLPLECSVAHSTPEPAPAIALHNYRIPFKNWYSPDAPGYYTPVAAYVDPGNPQESAPYARVALVPFAVVVDIITSPFQAIYFVIGGLSH